MPLFFKQRKPRGFNYPPRFYDPAEEAREKRKKEVLGDRYTPPADSDTGGTGGTGSAGSAGAGGGGEYRPGDHVRRSADARRAESGTQRGFSGFATQRGMRARGRKRPSLMPLIIMLLLLALAIWAMIAL